MHRGYCKIARRIHDDPLWQEKPFDRARAWIDLIMLARYVDGYIMVRGNKVELKRGQVGWSELALSDKWGWSRGKVNRFLVEMEKDRRIIQQKSRLTTLITIVNYNKFQSGDTTDNTTDSTTDGQQTVQQTDIKNKVKKEKKEKKESKRFVPPSVEEVHAYMKSIGFDGDASKFVDHYSVGGWVYGKAKTPIKDWKAAVRTWSKNNYNSAGHSGTSDVQTDLWKRVK
jgi:hypothetical protein